MFFYSPKQLAHKAVILNTGSPGPGPNPMNDLHACVYELVNASPFLKSSELAIVVLFNMRLLVIQSTLQLKVIVRERVD